MQPAGVHCDGRILFPMLNARFTKNSDAGKEPCRSEGTKYEGTGSLSAGCLELDQKW